MMVGPRYSRDRFADEIREILDDVSSNHERDALSRVSQVVEGAIALGDDVVQPSRWRRNERRGRVRARVSRSRGRLAMAALAGAVIASGGAVAVAQSDTVRDLFTADTPSTERMEAFKVTPTPTGARNSDSSAVPVEVQENLDLLWRVNPAGEPDWIERRSQTQTLLVDKWHGQDVAIYARATSDGKACYNVDLGNVGTLLAACSTYFDLKAPITIGGSVKSTRSGVSDVRFYGLAADEVTAVRVRLADGTSSDAVMGTNAFYWDDSDATSKPDFIDIEMSDGRVVTHLVETYTGTAWKGY